MAVSRRPASTRAISTTVVPLSSPTASPSAIRPATSLAMRFFTSRASSSLMANGNSSPRIIRLTAPPRTRRATPRSTRTSRSRRTVISAVPNSAAAVATSTRPCSRSASTSWLIRAAASMILNLHHLCSFAQKYCAYDLLRLLRTRLALPCGAPLRNSPQLLAGRLPERAPRFVLNKILNSERAMTCLPPPRFAIRTLGGALHRFLAEDWFTAQMKGALSPAGAGRAPCPGGLPCRHENRIPYRRERRSVGEIQGGHLFYRHPVPQRCRSRVDPLGRSLLADDLHSQQTSSAAFGGHLDVHPLGAREVAGLRGGPHGYGHVFEPGAGGVALAQPGPGDLQMAHLAHRRSDHPGKRGVGAGHIVPDDPALLVGVGGERHMLVLTRNQVEDLHAVAARPDMVVALYQHLHVRAEAAVIPQHQAGILCERGVRPYPEAEDDDVGRDRAVGGQHRADPVVVAGLES